jgi:transcriptional regulator with XRE-family HTH domain
VVRRGTFQHVDGLELKLLRVRADVTQIDLAVAMGCSNTYVSHIEARRSVPKPLADRYVAALATLTTKTTDPEVVA